MFLTDDEIQALTGHKRRHKQLAWLVERRIPHLVSAVGSPVVALREIERRLVQDPRIRTTKDRPRLDLVR